MYYLLIKGAFLNLILVSFKINAERPVIPNNPAKTLIDIPNPFSLVSMYPEKIGQVIAAILAAPLAIPTPMFLISGVKDSGLIVYIALYPMITTIVIIEVEATT